MVRCERTGDGVGPDSSLHPRDLDRVARTQNRWRVAHQIEVAQTSELLIVGYAGRAIAEADLGADVKVDLRAAIGGRAPEGFPFAPLVHREGPLHLGPDRMAWRCRGAAAVRQRRRQEHNCTDQSAQPEGSETQTMAVVRFIASPAATVRPAA